MVTIPRQSDSLYHTDLLGFWVLLSLEMIYAHGLKKIGIRVAEAEQVPNPLHLSEALNNIFAISSNIFFQYWSSWYFLQDYRPSPYLP